MVNSGARGTKNWNPRTEVDWYSTVYNTAVAVGQSQRFYSDVGVGCGNI
jgi:hypothetical protein